jgi:hypothetical protein
MARSSRRGRLLLLGAAVVAAGVFLKRDKVAGLLPSRAETYSPPATGPSNYDAPGPVANTATAVPVPEAYEPDPIDEAAEEAAAAAEAANIGGPPGEYIGPDGLPATEAERPLAEAGEGVAEGQEQAEFDLERAAEPTAPGMSGAEHQIEDAIEEAANPLAGETIEPVRPPEEPHAEAEGGDAATADTAEWAPPTAERPTPASTQPDEASPPSQPADEPIVGEGGPVPSPDEPAPFDTSSGDEPAASEESSGDDKRDDGGSDWRTWSGRSVNP